MRKKIHINLANKVFDFDIDNENIFYQGEKLAIDVRKYSGDRFNVLYKGKSFDLTVTRESDDKKYSILVNGKKIDAIALDELDLLLDKLGIKDGKDQKIGDIVAPMPGLIIDIPLKTGDTVDKGDQLLVLEAMKMENTIKATAPGTVKEICVTKGEKVEKGQVLLKFD